MCDVAKLRIQNFKALRDVTMDLKPLTILVGRNSSGKTSLLQSLLLLKQTVQSRDRWAPIVTRGDHVDLGGYRDFVFRHDETQSITFAVLLDIKETRGFKPGAMWLHRGFAGGPLCYMPWEYNETSLPDKVWISVTYCLTHPETTVVKQVEYQAEDGTPFLLAKRHSGRKDSYDVTLFCSIKGHKVEISYRDFVMRKFIDLFPSDPSVFERPKVRLERGLPRPGKESLRKAQSRILTIVSATAQEMEAFVDKITHLEPVREKPSRMYIEAGESKEHVGPTGGAAVEVLYALKKRRGAPNGHQGLEKKVLYWLRRLDLASKFVFKKLKGSSAFLFRLKDPSLYLLSGIADHGFGLSQILPLIVEGFCAHRGEVLLLEQPEIHLHPKAQAYLAEMLQEIAGRGVTIVAETHSVHLIERLQLLVAKDPSLHQQIGIYLFEMGHDGVDVAELALSKHGLRVNWPRLFAEGFLYNGFNDALEQESVIAKRVRRPGKGARR